MYEGPYRGYLARLAARMDSALEEIQVEHNFEYGEEFEVAICKLLRAALPERYGVCRGYVTTIKGDVAGDDVIIFERSRFPTLRLHERHDFSRKEYIPIEAVYAYIEAKYTLNLYGDGGQSLVKAAAQVEAVKTLLSRREAIHPGQYDPYVPADALGVEFAESHLPVTRNPPFGAIFAAGARLDNGAERTEHFGSIKAGMNSASVSSAPAPDLIVVGTNFVCLPVISSGAGEAATFASPFFIEGRSTYSAFDASGTAFGIALGSLMAALDWIRLGKMPWYEVLSSTLGVK